MKHRKRFEKEIFVWNLELEKSRVLDGRKDKLARSNGYCNSATLHVMGHAVDIIHGRIRIDAVLSLALLGVRAVIWQRIRIA